MVTRYNAEADRRNGLYNDWVNKNNLVNSLSDEIDNLNITIPQLSHDIHEEEYFLSKAGNGHTVIENAVTGDGNDTLIGNQVDNRLSGGRGNDQYTGGEGSDIFVIKKHAGDADTIMDMSNVDKLDLTDFKIENFAALNVNQIGSDTVITLNEDQSIRLSGYDQSDLTADQIIGLADQLNVIQGADLNDNLYGSNGNDHIIGADGDDYLSGRQGDNTLTGGAGKDTFFIDVNPGHTDHITDFETNAKETISLLEFSTIHTISDLTIREANGDTIIELADQQSIVLTGVQASRLTDESFIFYGEEFGDKDDNILIGSRLPDVMLGGAGNDNLFGGENDDRLIGGLGNDNLQGDHGDDVLYGSEGDDCLNGSDGDDRLVTGLGHDHVTGGSGVDQFIIEDSLSLNESSITEITDFDINHEAIDITSLVESNLAVRYSDLDISQQGVNTQIIISNSGHQQKIILDNIDSSVINAASFVGFASNKSNNIAFDLPMEEHNQNNESDSATMLKSDDQGHGVIHDVTAMGMLEIDHHDYHY